MSVRREEQKDEFLTLHGWGESSRSHLSGDASFRSYERVHREIDISNEETEEEIEPFVGKSLEFAVLMDAPPEKEDIAPFVSVAQLLDKYQLNSPKIIAEDYNNGFLLLEDFGDNSYNAILSSDATMIATPQAEEIYKRAIDVLTHLHKYKPAANIPDYNISLLINEVSLLIDWYIKLFNNIEISEDVFFSLWNKLFVTLDTLPKVLVLRDYHADNLMWLDSKKGFQQVGLLDFQDAVNGSPAYDLVSLLEDARRDISFDFAQKMLDYYLQQNPSTDSEALKKSYAILGAQRNIKILGIFARLALRDHKPKYLQFMPRVWKYLEHDLKHPALSEIKAYMDKYFPEEIRKNVPHLRGQHHG